MGSTGTHNTAIGALAGQNATGNYNIFIGDSAGMNEIGSYKLYINVGPSSTPLIGGDFSTSTVNVNGSLQVNTTNGGFVVPRMTTTERNALTPVNGTIIYNTTTNQFNFYENGAWVTRN